MPQALLSPCRLLFTDVCCLAVYGCRRPRVLSLSSNNLSARNRRRRMAMATSSHVVKVLDGGLGTELERAEGCDLLEHPLWSARLLKDNPKAVKEAHKRFILAGSNAVISASYQASVDGLIKHCDVSRQEAERLIQLSVDVAKDAVMEARETIGERECYVVGSVGPYGAILHDMSEYNGNYVESMTMDQLKDWHRERLRLLLSRNPDFVAVETMPALKEVLAILDLLKEFPDAKAWVAFACKDATSTFHGDDFKEAVDLVSRNPQVTSVGINCTHPNDVKPLLMHAKDSLAPGKTFLAYPNVTLEFQNTRWVKEASSRDLADYVPEWLELGVLEWIGGCCCSSPEDILKISEVVNSRNSNVG